MEKNEIQERILYKAHELFMRYGIRSVSMDEIAAHLGMSKKTIYQYYADKDSLVEEVIGIEIGRNEISCSQHREKSENALHEIYMAVDMVQELLKSMNTSLLYELEKYHPKAYKKLQQHKNEFMFKLIKENLQIGIDEGLYRNDIHLDIISYYRLSTVFIVFNPELFGNARFNPADIIVEITDNFLWGLATPKGQKLIQQYKQQRQIKP